MTNTLEVDDPEDKDFDPLPAWKDMPQDAIDYLKSLPEFDAVLFKRVTGIDVNIEAEKQSDVDVEVITINGKKYKRVD